jgi:glycosyltransferase involved in cell wall biosynthesis
LDKVVIIHNRLVIGGPAVAIAETIRQLHGRFQFYLVVGEPLPDEMEAGWLFQNLPHLTIIRLPGMRRSPSLLRDMRTYKTLKRLFREIQPRVVHTHGAKPGLLGRLAAAHCKVPVILHTYHGHVFHSYFNRFVSAAIVKTERWLARKSTGIIAISEQLQHELTAVYRIAAPENCHLIRLGLNLKSFSDNALQKRLHFRRRYLLNAGEVAVGIVGRITAIKHMHFFLTVVQAMQQGAAQIRYFIVGDGDEKAALQQWLTSQQIDFTVGGGSKATVTFTSWLQQADEVMNGLDIVCLTSLNEGTPVSLIEAAAAGRPVVTTAAGSVAEIVLQGQSGFITGQGALEEFCDRLAQLVANEALRVQMGETGRAHVTAAFDAAAAAEQTAALYLRQKDK